MTLTVRSQADQDFAEAIQFYLDEETPISAARFVDTIDTTYDEILEAPKRYPADRFGIREKIVQGFPFSIMYSLEPDEIIVLAIHHHKRKPGYWRKRT